MNYIRSSNANVGNKSWGAYPNMIAAYFAFHLNMRSFSWFIDKKSVSYPKYARYIIDIKDAAQLSALMEQIYDYHTSNY
jgi:hypothetical protein